MLFETLLSFGADMWNNFMQVIFIITGLVSIKSLTDMVTELVGQGNALKDGEEVGKEVKKRAFQTAGLGIAGLGVAKMGIGVAKAGAGVAKNVGSTIWNSDTMGKVRKGSRDMLKATASAFDDAFGVSDARNKKMTRNAQFDMYQLMGGKASGLPKPKGYTWRKTKQDVSGTFQLIGETLDEGLGISRNIARAKTGVGYAKRGVGAVKKWGSAGVGDIRRSLFQEIQLDENGNPLIDKKGNFVRGDSDEIKALKGAWAGYKGVAKDFNKQLMKMTGGMDVTKEFADESGQDDLVEKYTKALYGYKTEKTKAGEAAQGQADATIATLLRKTAGVGKGDYEDINEFNSVPIHTQDVNVRGATINLNANQANQNAGTVNQNAAATNNSSSSPQQVSLAQNSLQVALDSNSLSSIRDAENQTSANITARLNALAMGMSLLGQNVRDLETPLKEISKNTANIATNTKGRKKNN